MKIIYKKIKNTYLNLFISSPKLFSTIIFIPTLYVCGWVLASPILLLDLEEESISLLGTIFTFLLFVISLPKWFEIRWGTKNTWQLLGIKKFKRDRNFIFYFLRGFLLSAFLLSLIIIPIIATKWGYWLGRLSPEVFINSIFLVFGVGFAEELIFRGWLIEELKNQFGLKKAIVGQAIIFSIVHIGFDLALWEMISILTGLFFLGILLGLIRLKDNNYLWGCIGLHGGLVGLWFITNNGLIAISKDSPKFLIGPGITNTNPLGGIFGIALMILFCFLYLISFKKKNGKL